MTVRRTPGRRPGGPDTRGEILDAARETFAAKGFEGTSLRAVARAAGVDAALVHHYFDGKESLFVEAMALPIDPRVVAERVLDGPVEGIGDRIIGTFLAVWEAPESRVRMKAMLRAAISSEDYAHLIRDAITRLILGPVSSVLDVPDAQLRVSLVASQLMGVVLVRYIIELDPLASATPDEVVARIAPTIQRYLTE
ncbi:MAG: TetR family transcriptional regulator [Kribbellaceae bacterium]|nr:TetR family transcriptional regulator [Kribbellaceae bacterium]